MEFNRKLEPLFVNVFPALSLQFNTIKRTGSSAGFSSKQVTGETNLEGGDRLSEI